MIAARGCGLAPALQHLVAAVDHLRSRAPSSCSVASDSLITSRRRCEQRPKVDQDAFF
jgi:hypothetical protein